MPRSRKAMSRVKNRKKNATVDLRVQRSRIVVKMNHPYEVSVEISSLSFLFGFEACSFLALTALLTIRNRPNEL